MYEAVPFYALAGADPGAGARVPRPPQEKAPFFWTTALIFYEKFLILVMKIGGHMVATGAKLSYSFSLATPPLKNPGSAPDLLLSYS